MWYVYVLEYRDMNYMYVGSTGNLKLRLAQHNSGESKATKPYIPLQLISYVAVNSEPKARRLEKYFKSGSGNAILKKRILQTEALA